MVVLTICIVLIDAIITVVLFCLF